MTTTSDAVVVVGGGAMGAPSLVHFAAHHSELFARGELIRESQGV